MSPDLALHFPGPPQLYLNSEPITVSPRKEIAALLIAKDKPEKAAQWIRCADATREKIPDIRPLIEEADMYRNMAAVLSRIGPPGFEVAYDEGRSTTLEEAIRYALET
jgi:hypothetical protein